MTRSQMRVLLKRRLNEPTAGDQWANAELNELLNLGLQATETFLLAADPEAVVRKSQCATVTGQNEYGWPTDMLYEIEVSLLNATSGAYDVVSKRPFADIRDLTTSETQCYAHWGRYCYLAPAPAAGVAAGLRITHVPALTMADDTSVPKIPAQWHMMVVLNAQILALGEGADSAKGPMAERDSLYGQLQAVHRNSAAAPSPLEPSVVRDYGAGCQADIGTR